MAQSEMKNTPPLYGWIIGIAAGAVATGVSLIAVGIEGNGSVAIGLVIALVVGTVFTIAERPPRPAMKAGTVGQITKPAQSPTTNSEKSAQDSEPVVAPVMPEATADPVAESAVSEDGIKPEMLTAPAGTPDDLKQISGVGPVLEAKLNDLGVYHFWQIARWTPAEVAWVDGFLNFKGRISRDDWIAQATTLAASSPSRPPE